MGLICYLPNGMKARVSFNGTRSEEISINNGVKQGDISSPMLFNIYFAIVFLVAFYENSDGIYIRYRTSGSVFNVRRLLSQGKVSSSLVRELLYADDCDIVAHSEDELQSQHGIKLHTKIIVYKVCVLTALLYASDTSTLYKHQLKLLEGFNQQCLRQILHIKWQSHVSDTEV